MPTRTVHLDVQIPLHLSRWDTGTTAWHVAMDGCPHRLAPLSEGRVDESGHIDAMTKYFRMTAR